MDYETFFDRRNNILSKIFSENLEMAEVEFRNLLTDCKNQNHAEPNWEPIVKSELAIIKAKKCDHSSAVKLLAEAHTSELISNQIILLFVMHNGSIVYDIIGDKEQSVNWSWETSEITRKYELYLSNVKVKDKPESIFFEIGSMALHGIIDYYYLVESDFGHAQTFIPEAVRWVEKAIKINKDYHHLVRPLWLNKAQLLRLIGEIKISSDSRNEGKKHLKKALKFFKKAGDESYANKIKMVIKKI